MSCIEFSQELSCSSSACLWTIGWRIKRTGTLDFIVHHVHRTRPRKTSVSSDVYRQYLYKWSKSVQNNRTLQWYLWLIFILFSRTIINQICFAFMHHSVACMNYTGCVPECHSMLLYGFVACFCSPGIQIGVVRACHLRHKDNYCASVCWPSLIKTPSPPLRFLLDRQKYRCSFGK